MFHPLALQCIVKNGQNDHFSEGTKVRRSNAPLMKLFSVDSTDSYDLRNMSFKFGKINIT